VITEAAVRSILNGIVDPCSAAAGAPAGLNDMGLIRRVQLDHSGGVTRLKVVIAVTEFGCLMGAPFALSAFEVLSELDDIDDVSVELDDKFDWAPEDMAPEYRRRLADRRHAREAAAPIAVVPVHRVAGHEDGATVRRRTESSSK
jgi:metal-sulfur cluster biosynthetic enzyme